MISQGGRVLNRDHGPEEVHGSGNRYAIVAIRLYRNHSEYSTGRHEDRHLFVVAADMAFQACDTMVNNNILVDLLHLACRIVQTCTENKWKNCGCYYELPWVATLLERVLESEKPRSQWHWGPRNRPLVNFPWPHVLQLLDCLEQSMNAGLLPGSRIGDDIRTLRDHCPLSRQELRNLDAQFPPITDNGVVLNDAEIRSFALQNGLLNGHTGDTPGDRHWQQDHIPMPMFGRPDHTIVTPGFAPPWPLPHTERLQSVDTVNFSDSSGPEGILDSTERLYPPPLSTRFDSAMEAIKQSTHPPSSAYSPVDHILPSFASFASRQNQPNDSSNSRPPFSYSIPVGSEGQMLPASSTTMGLKGDLRRIGAQLALAQPLDQAASTPGPNEVELSPVSGKISVPSEGTRTAAENLGGLQANVT